jgi:hypothetical protein
VRAPAARVGARAYIGCDCRLRLVSRRYLSCMSLVTDFTPPTALATPSCGRALPFAVPDRPPPPGSKGFS